MQTFEGVAGALDYCRDVTKIKIEWDVEPEYLNFRLMLQWMKVAAKLRTLPSLQSLKLTAYCPSSYDEEIPRTKYPFADMFFDSLPDKVIELTADGFRCATLLRKRTAQLECVSFSCFPNKITDKTYFADLFRLKSKRIAFPAGWMPPSYLSHLHNCGPLDRNERLQELHISDPIAADGNIPQALRHLRALNDHFKLE